MSFTTNQAKVYYACFYGDLQSIRVLRALGVNFDIIDYNGRTPLHIAAIEGNEDIVTFLVACGVSVLPVDNRGVDARVSA